MRLQFSNGHPAKWGLLNRSARALENPHSGVTARRRPPLSGRAAGAALALWFTAAASVELYAAPGFRFEPRDDGSLALIEGERPVLVYNHRIRLRPGVPADRARSAYVHPLYGLDGEVLTDDFPADYYHHRGLFWAWPHVRVGDQHYDLWMLRGIQHRFERWLARSVTAESATVGVENAWIADGRDIMRERVWLRAAPATEQARVIDLVFVWEPLGQSVTLAGAEGKNYGGLTLRSSSLRSIPIIRPSG